MSQAEFHQLQLERQQMAQEALKRLAAGLGGERDCQVLADELRIPWPPSRPSMPEEDE